MSPAKLFLGREMRSMGDMVARMDAEQLSADTHSFAHYMYILTCENRTIMPGNMEKLQKERTKSNFDRGADSESVDIGSHRDTIS